MNQLSTADRTRVLACLVEGNSQRATVRMTGIAKGTVAKLAVEFQTDPLPRTYSDCGDCFSLPNDQAIRPA